MFGGFSQNPVPTMILGITEDEVAQIKSGSTMLIPMATFIPGYVGNLCVLYGPTSEDIASRLQRAGLMANDSIPSPVANFGPTSHADVRAERLRRHSKILVGVMGLPRSGKSTWAKEQGCPVVSPDALRLSMTGQAFFKPAESMIWGMADIMVRSLFEAGHKVVILDATNTTKARRQRWFDLSWKTYWKPMATEAILCENRARSGNRLDLLPIIEGMAASWENLSEDEEIWI